MQKTIKSEAEFKGIGIHTGHKVKIKLKPADVNSGISFVRIDLPNRPKINIRDAEILDSVESPRRTSIRKDGARVETIEHLMASLMGLEIDNIIVELDSDELPGADGSALLFVELLEKAGIKTQDGPDRIFQLREPIWCQGANGASIVALPSSEFRVSYTLKYELPYIEPQYVSLGLNTDVFKSSIAPSRTFCIEEEVGDLKNEGLGRGADYKNTLVVNRQGKIVENVPRFKDEFARHKVLDLMGDLYLSGYKVKAHVIAVRSGHFLNIKIANKIKEKIMESKNAGIKPSSKSSVGSNVILDQDMIKKIIPHREPFLFVDKIVELVEDKSAKGVKYLSKDEYFYKGHFPGHPVTPGVLILEALAQVGGVLMLGKKENLGKIAYFMCIDNAKFRKAVMPGDEVYLEIEVIKIRTRTGQMRGVAKVKGKVVTEADFMFSLIDV